MSTMYIKVKSSLLKVTYRTKVVLGRMYKLNDGSDQYFKVERLKGVFAWGYRINSKIPEEGLPLALLKFRRM